MRAPDLQIMHKWDESLIREVSYFDWKCNAEITRIEYLGPDGTSHYLKQPFDNPDRPRAVELLRRDYKERYPEDEGK